MHSSMLESYQGMLGAARGGRSRGGRLKVTYQGQRLSGAPLRIGHALVTPLTDT